MSEKRLRYAKLQKDRSEIKWHVLGRDESKLVVIWSKLASEEKRVPGFVMVWGCISANGVGDLVKND